MSHVLAYHLILTFYGSWLPNDERGSGTETVWSDNLRPFGNGTKHLSHCPSSVTDQPLDPEWARAARRALKYPEVRLTGRQAKVVALAIRFLAARDGLTFHAFAILPDHLHCVVIRHARWTCEQIMNRIKGVATHALLEEGVHPLAVFAKPNRLPPKLFTRGGWKAFCYNPGSVRERINYVEQNPVKAGLRLQRWRFVEPYVDV